MGAVQKVEPQSGTLVVTDETTLLTVIGRLASDPNADIDKMERLMQLHDRLSAKRAEQEFNESLSRVQAATSRISADANNPQTRSRYATYAQLDRHLRPIYTQEGLSLSFDTADSPNADCLRVVCYVSKGGYTRTYHVDMPNDGKGAKGGDVMTKTHAQGAASAYGMRYLVKMIFNVAIGEDDNDGNAPEERQPSASVARRTKWLQMIEAATTADQLKTIKHDCCVEYGMPDKVPPLLRSAFIKRGEALEAQP